MAAARTLFCAHMHMHTHNTHSSIWALQGITDQAGVNELIITANSICHRDQSRPGASARGACVCVLYICVFECESMEGK